VFRCRAGQSHGRADATAGARDLLIAGTLKPELELPRPVAGMDEMGMAVDQARHQPATGEVMDAGRKLLRLAGQLLARTEPDDAPAGCGDGAVLDGAIGAAARDHGREPAVDPQIVPHDPSLGIVAPMARAYGAHAAATSAPVHVSV